MSKRKELMSIMTTEGLPVHEVARRLVQPKHPWLIDPRTSRRIGYWDMITSVALIFTATITPYEIALLEPKWDILFIVNRCVDSIFTLDIFVQFIMMTEKNAQSLSHGAIWVTDPCEIALNYLKSWFFLDVFTIGVSAFDIYAVMAQQTADTVGTGSSAATTAQDLSNLTVLKTLRVLRLVKLIRLVRSSRIAKRWEMRVAVDYAMLAIVKCIMMVLVSAHWMACVWVIQAYMVAEPPMATTWIGNKDYCRVNQTAVDWNMAHEPAHEVPWFECETPATIYCAAIYWAVMTITSVGYGDIAASLSNEVEQAVCTALMLISSLIYAQVIGTYCGVVATLNPDLAAFRETMQDLNRFMYREQLPNDMQRRLREYFHQSRHLRMAETQRTLMQHMPPSLKGEVAWMTNSSWLKKIWFLRNAPHSFMVDLAMSLHAMVFAPGDTPKLGFMYIVHRGVAIYQAKLITKGRVFGEDMILSSPHLRSTAQAKAMNYLEVYYTSRRELISIAVRYPKTAAAIRRAAILIALRREIILMAKLKMGVDPREKISAAARLVSEYTQAGAPASADIITMTHLLNGHRRAADVERAAMIQVSVASPDLVTRGFAENSPTDGRGGSLSSPSKKGSAKGRPPVGGRTTSTPKTGGDNSDSQGGANLFGGDNGVSLADELPFDFELEPMTTAGVGHTAGVGSPSGPASSADSLSLEQAVSKVNDAQQAEISKLRADFEQRFQRQEAQIDKAVKTAEGTARSVDDLVKSLNLLSNALEHGNNATQQRKHSSGKGRVANGATPLIPAVPPSVSGGGGYKTVTHVVNSVTSVTAEDRYQDGDREPHRDRPEGHRRRRKTRSPGPPQDPMLAA